MEQSEHKLFGRTYPALIFAFGLVGVDSVINYLEFNSSAFIKISAGLIRTITYSYRSFGIRKLCAH